MHHWILFHRNCDQTGGSWVYISTIVPLSQIKNYFKKSNILPWYSSACQLFLSSFCSHLILELRNSSQNSGQLHMIIWWCNKISSPWSICAKTEAMQICCIYRIMTIFPKTVQFFIAFAGLQVITASFKQYFLNLMISRVNARKYCKELLKMRVIYTKTPFFSVYKERIWQSHNLGLISDQHVQNVRDIQPFYMYSSPLERQLSMGHCCLPEMQLEKGLAWIPNAGSQSFIRWQVWVLVQVPGSPGKREFCCCLQCWLLPAALQ